MDEITKEEYFKALEIVGKYNKQKEAKRKEVESNCDHEWVLEEGWGGHIEGNTYCKKCKMDNPNNWH